MPKLVKPCDENIDNPELAGATAVQVKVPRRILHFSDGTLEEYSDDEPSELDAKPAEAVPAVDPKTLAWGPWTSHMVWSAGTSALATADYVGEWLASAFGITTPKYYFEIEEHKRREAEKQRREDESRGWSENAQDGVQLVTKDVAASRAAAGEQQQQQQEEQPPAQ